MWYKEVLAFGWMRCWIEDQNYWFFSSTWCPAHRMWEIEWYHTTKAIGQYEGPLYRGLSPDIYSKVSNGVLNYNTQQEIDAAWAQLWDNPDPFLVRIAMHVG